MSTPRLSAERLDYEPGWCTGHTAAGWRRGEAPPRCRAMPKFIAGGWPACGLHVGWLLRQLVEHGHTRIDVTAVEAP